MKYLSSIILIIAIFSISLLTNCGESTPASLSLQQKATKILHEGSPWGGSGNVEVLASPTGVDITELENNLQVSFKSSGAEDWAPTFFDATGAEDFLEANNAIWYWTGSGTDNITLEEASVAELTSVEVSDETVTFTFEVSNLNGGGRIAGFDGTYTVRLK